MLGPLAWHARGRWLFCCSLCTGGPARPLFCCALVECLEAWLRPCGKARSLQVAVLLQSLHRWAGQALRERKKREGNYSGRKIYPTSIKEKGPPWCTDRMYPPTTTKFRLREVWQGEKEGTSSLFYRCVLTLNAWKHYHGLPPEQQDVCVKHTHGFTLAEKWPTCRISLSQASRGQGLGIKERKISACHSPTCIDLLLIPIDLHQMAPPPTP